MVLLVFGIGLGRASAGEGLRTLDGNWLMVGPSYARWADMQSHRDTMIGAELSLAWLNSLDWQGFYLDVSRSTQRNAWYASLGIEGGKGVIGMDTGLAVTNTNGAFQAGIVLTPRLTVGVASLGISIGCLIAGKNPCFGEASVLLKVPLRQR